MGALETQYLVMALAEFRRLQGQGAKAMAQVSDDAALERMLDPESNSVGTIVRHLAGNMRSRWTDFLTTDGEKADRHRDGEFDTETRMSRADLLATWESGWQRVFAAVEPLTSADLERTVTIRGKGLSVLEAINQSIVHYASHVGQIVYVCRHLAGAGWTSLSVPRGQSPRG